MCVLHGGDDYELLFTAAPQQQEEVLAAGHAAGVALSCIGRIDEGSALLLVDGSGHVLDMPGSGFDHFKS
jgi:thiamine-monophosphate kinase